MAKVKTWVWVVVGISVAGILAIVAMAAAGLWFAKTHIDVQPASASSASSEFERIREQFASQKPLLELDDRGHLLRANTNRPASDKRPETLYVLAYSPDEGGRVVRVNIPFWILRLKMRGSMINIGGRNLDMEDLKLTVEDLERYGPTLIVDQDDRRGAHVLVWTQ
jgi:hypothetical protein